MAGENRTAVDILSAGRNEAKLIPISLSDLSFSRSCIKPKDIDSIVFVANSDDGLKFIRVEFFATFSVGEFDNWVDGNSDPIRLRVPVHP